MDMFVEQTHEVPADHRSADRPMRYTDTRMDEQVGAGGGLLLVFAPSALLPCASQKWLHS